MGSMVTADGAPRAWRRLRAQWAKRLPLPCGQCGNLVMPGEPWALGHIIARCDGGDDSEANLWPEHARCSSWSGGQLGGARSRLGGADSDPCRPGGCRACRTLGAQCNGRGRYRDRRWDPGLPPSRAW